MVSHKYQKSSLEALLVSPASPGPSSDKGFRFAAFLFWFFFLLRFPHLPVNQMPVQLTKRRLGGVKFRSRMQRSGKDFLSFLHFSHPDL